MLELLGCWFALGTLSHPLSVSSSVSAGRLGNRLSLRPSHPRCSSKEKRRLKSLYLTISCLWPQVSGIGCPAHPPNE